MNICKVKESFKMTFLQDESINVKLSKGEILYYHFDVDEDTYFIHRDNSEWSNNSNMSGFPISPENFNNLFTTQREENLNSLIDPNYQ